MNFEYQYIVDRLNRNNVQVSSIGHENLERNKVFLIDSDLILKIYSINKTWERELKSLIHLSKSDDLYPTIVDFGFGSNSEKWILLSKLPGKPLSEVVSLIDPVELEEIYLQIGKYHAHFHKENRTEEYYDWATSSQSFKHYNSYEKFEIDKNRRRADYLISQNYLEHELFVQSYNEMKQLEETLTGANIFSLCHNDFSERNILVEKKNEHWEITGLIDFELAYPSCPDSDIAKMVFENYTSKYLIYYLKGYCSVSNIDELDWNRLKYYLYALCLEICSWSRDKDRSYYNRSVKLLSDLSKVNHLKFSF